MNFIDEWYLRTGLQNYHTHFEDVQENLKKMDPRYKPLTMSPEVEEFMKDDVPLHCPHLLLLQGCMNCEYDELYKFCRCTKNNQNNPCTEVLKLSK